MGGMKNLTPEHMRCGVSCDCPSVHQLDDGRLVIIGGLAWSVDRDDDPALNKAFLRLFDEGKIGAGEAAIVVDPALLANVIARG